MISVNHLTKIYKSHDRQNNIFVDIFFRRFKEHIALNDISFEIGTNEFVGFIGPNGAGKTTTLKILSGILFPTSGTVSVLGHNPFEKKHSFLRSISFIMGQRNQLMWELPVSDSFYLQKAVYEIEDNQYKKTVEELTSLLQCKHLINKQVKTLSLGERMKMELIVGLLHSPTLVFLDEPTIGLDIFSQEAIRSFIRNYQEQHKATIILTSHYMEDVKRLAKHLIIINKGVILYDGTLKEIVEQYSQEKRIKITLDRHISEKKINYIAKPLFYTYPQVIYSIKRALIPEKIKQIIEILPFTDLTVEDENIEDIIKLFFKKKQK